MVVGVDLPYKTAQDVAEAARKAPGKLNYGSSGNGGYSHFEWALFREHHGHADHRMCPLQGLGPGAGMT